MLVNPIVEELRALKPTLKSVYGIFDVALFGSYATNTATKNLDFIVDEINGLK